MKRRARHVSFLVRSVRTLRRELRAQQAVLQFLTQDPTTTKQRRLVGQYVALCEDRRA